MKKTLGIMITPILVAGCSQNAADEAKNSANTTSIPAAQAEQDAMSNGFSGERSSGEPATGSSDLGTTGQSNVSGAGPSGATGSQNNGTGNDGSPDR